MKKKILLLLIIFISSCCKEDDTALVCISDCTVVQGQIVTSNGKPLANIPIEFRHNSSRPYSSSIRRIKKATTDENGYYSMEFFIESDELGSEAKGYFELIIDYSKLDEKVYMNNSPFYDITISSINSRDTTVTMDFYNPKKAYITVNLNGFNPSTGDDYFRLESFFPSGIKSEKNNIWGFDYLLGYGTSSEATSANSEIDSVLVAENDNNWVRIRRRKDGVGLMDQDTIFFVPENNTIELNFTY